MRLTASPPWQRQQPLQPQSKMDWGLIMAEYQAKETTNSAKHESFSTHELHKIHSSMYKLFGQGPVDLC